LFINPITLPVAFGLTTDGYKRSSTTSSRNIVISAINWGKKSSLAADEEERLREKQSTLKTLALS